jgi:2-polyprenyl-3-methyl-5-hydroxy-6-metoxy-1,4-benzoquinol methylase
MDAPTQDDLDWQNPESVWDAHPSNHRLVPGGSEYESRYLWVREQIQPGSKVLDVGCNCGQLAINLATDLECEVWGVDIVQEFITHCQTCREKDLIGPFFCLDFSRMAPEVGRHLGLTTGQFDVVTALEVIEHPVDMRGFRDNLCAALKPGGQLILTTPHPASREYGYTYLRSRAHHVRMWSRKRLELVFGPMAVYYEIYTNGELNQIGAVWIK